MTGTKKELMTKRKLMLLQDLKSTKQRMHEVSLLLQRPKAFEKEQYNEICSEHNSLQVKAGNTERCLYAEFSMSDTQIEHELKTLKV